MHPKNVLIVKADSGIGLGVVKELVALNNAPSILFATCKSPSSAGELELVACNATVTKIHIISLDVASSAAEVLKVFEFIEDEVGEHGLNLIVNCHDSTTLTVSGLEEQTVALIMKSYEQIAIAPFLLIRMFIPLLQRAATVTKKSCVVNITDLDSSVDLNIGPDQKENWNSRMAKTALNMMLKTMSIELKRDNVLIMPICKSELKNGQMSVSDAERVAAGVVKLILNANDECSGELIDFTGSSVKW